MGLGRGSVCGGVMGARFGLDSVVDFGLANSLVAGVGGGVMRPNFDSKLAVTFCSGVLGRSDLEFGTSFASAVGGVQGSEVRERGPIT